MSVNRSSNCFLRVLRAGFVNTIASGYGFANKLQHPGIYVPIAVGVLLIYYALGMGVVVEASERSVLTCLQGFDKFLQQYVRVQRREKVRVFGH